MPQPLPIAYFITPHGFGHAARSAAVMMALNRRIPSLRFEIFTLIPETFFTDSLRRDIGYHPVLTDIGLVQKNSLEEDLPTTSQRLAEFLPFVESEVTYLAEQVQSLGCQAVLCDIAPLGITVAHAAGLPSILIENFTWDWIYEGYVAQHPALAQSIPYLQALFQAADFHIQTTPVCNPQAVDLTTSPVSRKLRSSRSELRAALTVPENAKLVMLTMGGNQWDYTFLDEMAKAQDCTFVIAGNGEVLQRFQNIIMLPQRSDFFHPDLVNTCDAIIGKVGYSTLAEVYQAGTPFGYIPRDHFRESPLLTAFIEREMTGLPLTPVQFQSGAWLTILPELLALPRNERPAHNGADEIADFVIGILESQKEAILD